MGAGPDRAFLLAISGVLAIYAEFIWPGRFFPGILGTIALVTGSYFLWRNSPTVLGLALIASAAFLFAVEAIWDTAFLCGIAGTVSLALGFCKLFAGPGRITPALAISVCIVFGVISVFLAYSAKCARRNKWSDLTRAE